MSISTSQEASPEGTTVGRMPDGTAIGRIGAVMATVALTLAVASALHLSGHVQGRSSLFSATDAGLAEAIIGAVLGAGAIAMARAPVRARRLGLGAIGFAIVGFLVGLGITARGGHLPDLAYHLTVLPVLIASLVVLWRTGPSAPGPGSLLR